ncbi:MAG: DUF86 domain-containing protein [Symploca sp. SIO2E6]|nr:DUF86 domain-containing protein [Symploca sp. SIO2E6]
MRDDGERLQDILEAIAQVEKYSVRGRQVFDQDELVQVWIVHHLQIIGEAANSLSSELITRYSRIPWAQIVAFRNLLVHEYFRVDLDAVWTIVQRNLPDLKNQIKAIIAER